MLLAKTSNQGLITLGLLAGFGAAVWVRVVIGGPGVSQSAVAGLVFAVCLAGLGVLAGTKIAINRRALLIGIIGGVALCIPALIARVISGAHSVSAGGYFSWALVVAAVATAEEYFLRGTLYDAVLAWRGETLAIILGSAAFALLHVPLYGWHVLPLDLAVGLWLGSLRAISKTCTAPAIAHTLADLVGWWLR